MRANTNKNENTLNCWNSITPVGSQRLTFWWVWGQLLLFGCGGILKGEFLYLSDTIFLPEGSIVSFHSFETCWYILLTYRINILIMENPPYHFTIDASCDSWKNWTLSGGTYVYIEYQVGRLIEVVLGFSICRWGGYFRWGLTFSGGVQTPFRTMGP